jgi:hypothetical protein
VLADPEGDTVTRGDVVTEAEAEGDGLSVEDTLPDTEPEADVLTEGEGDIPADADSDGEELGVTLTVTDALALGDLVGKELSVAVAVGTGPS